MTQRNQLEKREKIRYLHEIGGKGLLREVSRFNLLKAGFMPPRTQS